VYKIGRTTEPDVGDRVSALNSPGSNYPTANGADWEIQEQFVFANADQMTAFESAMIERLDAGVDPLGTGATELFRSSDLDADVTQALQAALRDLVEGDYISRSEIAHLAEASDLAPPGSASEIADLAELPPELAEEALDKSVSWLFELAMMGTAVGGIGIAIWRGKRLLGWARHLWEQSKTAARKQGVMREAEPESVTHARAAFRAMKRQLRNKE